MSLARDVHLNKNLNVQDIEKNKQNPTKIIIYYEQQKKSLVDGD